MQKIPIPETSPLVSPQTPGFEERRSSRSEVLEQAIRAQVNDAKEMSGRSSNPTNFTDMALLNSTFQQPKHKEVYANQANQISHAGQRAVLSALPTEIRRTFYNLCDDHLPSLTGGLEIDKGVTKQIVVALKKNPEIIGLLAKEIAKNPINRSEVIINLLTSLEPNDPLNKSLTLALKQAMLDIKDQWNVRDVKAVAFLEWKTAETPSPSSNALNAVIAGIKHA